MSGPPCKAALCLEAAAAAATELKTQVDADLYNEEELDAMTDCADRFLKDLVRISEG